MMPRSLRDKFEENYTAIPVPANNKAGFRVKYVYTAPWYFWDLPKEKLSREKCVVAGASILSLVVFCLISIQALPLNQKWYTVFPAAIALCFHILELSGVVQFLFSSHSTTQMTYQEIRRILEYAPAGRMIACILAGICGGIFSFNAGINIATVLWIGSHLSCGALAWLEIRRFSAIPVRTEKNRTLETIVKL